MRPNTPYPETSDPYFSVAVEIHERYHHKLSCKPTSSDICTVCPQAGKVSCPGCKLVQYCSQQCLRKDLPIHALFCKDFKLFRAAKRPYVMGLRYFRAILIPENGSPRWTWIKTTPDLLYYFLDHLYDDLPYHCLTQGSESIHLGYHSTRVPKHGIVATMRCQLSRGENRSSLNKFLLSQGPPGHLATNWGPMIVVAFKAGDPAKKTGPLGLLGQVEDLEMADVPHIFHTLVNNLPENPCVVDITRFAHKTIAAIKINCLGDRRRFHPSKDAFDDAAIYEIVTVHNVAYDRSIQWPSISAFALGLPWICRGVTTSKDFWVKARPEDKGEWIPEGKSLRNPELGCLHHIFGAPGRPESSHILVPARIDRDDNLGTMLIFHMYGEVIPAEHIKMFRLFCEENDIVHIWDKPQQATRVFKEASFRAFWETKKNGKPAPGLDLSGVPSPYAWRDKPRREGIYMEDRQLREIYESILERAVTDPSVFGYTPTSRPILASMSSLSFEEFQKQLGNDLDGDESCTGGR